MRFKSQKNPSSTSHADFLRRYARSMLRDARSEHPSKALPIIRRVHAVGIFPIARLSDLYHARESLQLKHVLRTIAAELGYATWNACKHDVDYQPSSVLDRFRLDIGGFGDYEKIWFSSESAAQEWRRTHGGHVVVYGSQAVLMTA
jgi:hypothetical protein